MHMWNGRRKKLANTGWLKEVIVMDRHITKNIYMHLQDEASKQIFERRLMYSLTDDYKFVTQLIESLPQKKKVDKLMEKAGQVSGQLIVYGAGNDFKLLSRLYPGFSFKYLCDRDIQKQKNGWNGYRVISPEQLILDYLEDYVLITTTGFHKEIYDFLKKNGIKEEHIINVGAVTGELYRQQYFDDTIMRPVDGEVFVDGGCYDGSTSRLFAEWCGGNYRKIYAFEPDTENYNKCKGLENEIRDIKLMNKGLWSKASVLRFAGDGSQGARLVGEDAEGTVEVPVAAIDETVAGDKVTFIKLDVEGAELEALKGAQDTIRQYHPKLAVSIYHKKEDIWEIPAYILSLSEDYRLYIRHYQFSENETILYAV